MLFQAVVLSAILLAFVAPGPVAGLFFGGGGGGCGCQPPPPCPPPAPAPCPPPPPAPCGGGCKARGTKNFEPTVVRGQVGPADELELRAQLAGFSLDSPVTSHNEDHLALIETLGEEDSSVAAALERARNSKTARFAPQNPASGVDATTTVAPKTSADANDNSNIKCNNVALKQIIINNISESSTKSKHAVNAAAEKEFGGPIDVICSRGHFSYVYSSNLFCEAAKGEVTCIAFRQSV